MTKRSCFFAYPGDSQLVNQTIDEMAKLIKKRHPDILVVPWKEYGPYGRLIQDKVRTLIDQSTCFIADITYPNFNVAFELGYAVSRNKPTLLIRNATVSSKSSNTWYYNFISAIEWIRYHNFDDLTNIVARTEAKVPIYIRPKLDLQKPLAFFNSQQKTNDSITIENSLLSMFTIKTHHLTDNPGLSPALNQTPTESVLVRIHDPSEDGPLTVFDAIDSVRLSLASICFLQSNEIRQSVEHNIKMAFVIGFSLGLRKQLLVLRHADMEAPADILDITTSWRNFAAIEKSLVKFKDNFSIMWRQLLDGQAEQDLMGNLERVVLTFGDAAAENESDIIHSYYVETDQYSRAKQAEGRIIVGRKGSGKTALFYKLKHYLSYKYRDGLVVHLAPAESQLVRFKEDFVKITERGAALHLFEILWQAVLLIELGRELLQLSRNRADHALFLSQPAARALVELFGELGMPESGDILAAGDFSEELEIVRRFFDMSDNERENPTSTEFLRRTKLRRIRTVVLDIFRDQGISVWILIDNLDKAFNPGGIDLDDCAMISCLLDAIGDLKKSGTDRGVELFPLLFLRSDVYELLVVNQSDRGKEHEIELDCTDPDVLKQVIFKRLARSGLPEALGFEGMWARVVADGAFGGSSWEYFLERCLMRPRFLIRFMKTALNVGIRRGHDFVQQADIEDAEREYSKYAVEQIGFELLDTSEILGKDILYIFMEKARYLTYTEIVETLKRKGLLEGADDELRRADEIVRRFTWYGVLGVRRGEQEIYIYDNQYKREATDVYWDQDDRNQVEFCLNKAFGIHLRLR